jgi:catecholate siderophore receptor
MRRMLWLALAVFVLPAAVLAGSVSEGATAQPSPQPSLQGRVLDSSGAPIAGARVTAAPESRGAVISTATDQQGEFTLVLVTGVYTLRIAAAGFRELTQRVTAPASAEGTREFVLQVATVVETVDVSAPGGYQVPAAITATKTPTLLRDVPQAITVIPRTAIDDQRMGSMADVVRYVPGIGMAQGEGNRDTPIFRGNSSTSDFFVDGVRDDAQYFRDLYNVDRIEALKGPNAMIFGRGGVGGVINRVSRQAGWAPFREVSLQAGSWENRRITADFGQGVNDRAALRVTGVYENSDSYRKDVGLERYGVNPTVAFSLGQNTTLRAGYEFFHDDRTADRGISSYQGRPVDTDPSTFFGNPDLSTSDITANVLTSMLEHRFGPRATIRSRVSYGDYDKFYQNVFPGAVNAAGTSVSISGYNNATVRRNLFSQTDLTFIQRTGGVEHTLLAGVELGRQATDNLRLTGYFTTLGQNVTSVLVPLDNPVTSLPVEFRASATDADNHGVATVASLYAQDQIALSRHVQAVVGLRYDSFDVDFRNNRTGLDFSSRDGLVSPRASLIYKPIEPVSLYGSYTLAYLPRAGEQLASLQLTNQALDPEEFRNYELGAKWDVAPAISFTAAVYRLDRGNVAVPDPLDPTVSILVDAQRTKGLEIGLGGSVTRAWSIVGGYAYQDGEITRSVSATAQAGATLGQLPKHSFSLWNKYAFTSALSAGLGIVSRAEMFTSTDTTVVLPGFTRVDAAVFYNIGRGMRAQVNIENLLDENYYASAHSNTNITPGSPRAVRVALTTRF